MSDIVSRLNAALEGRYRIERELGEVGMATVYLANDVRHDRQVAIKVLRPELAAVIGAERFLAEIRTTANLQHPHILPLFDSGEADGFLFYVMPYVEGESLRERLDRDRQLPVQEAVRIASDLSEALDHAHRKGVVHRDIKPANVLIQDGRPLIADFGIALAVGSAGGARLTETGLSLGTPYYMSPEQATGDQTVGLSSDIYALGCVLFELLVGEPPYVGPTAQAVLGKIITGGPVSARERRKSVPEHVDGAIQKALERVPADRFPTGGDFGLALGDEGFRHGERSIGGGPTNHPRFWRRVSAALIVVLAVFAWGTLDTGGPGEGVPVLRVGVMLPEGEALAFHHENRLALSPDGTRLAYVGGGSGGSSRIWVRNLSELGAQPIRDTEGACCLTYSPDGQSIAYLDLESNIKVVSEDGASRTLAEVNRDRGRLDWAEDGYLYLGGSRGITRVPQGGGVREYLTEVDRELSETDHFYPDALPNGRGVLYSVYYGSSTSVGLFVLDLESGESRQLLDGHSPRYVRSGHIFFASPDDDLMAVPFDASTLQVTGPPTTIAEGLMGPLLSADFSISQNGTLVYAGGVGGMEQLVWVGRSGAEEEIDLEWVENFESVALSPGADRVAVAIQDVEGLHLWIRGLPDGAQSRFTLEGEVNFRPRWSPDGDSILFVSERGGTPNNLISKGLRGGQPQVLLDLDRSIWEGAWSPDGQYLVYRLGTPPTRDLFVKHIHADSVGRTISASDEAEEVMPALSPDGRWLAYQSSETGRYEIYVRPFPNIDDAKFPVSTDGGMEPRWNPRGGELFFKSLDEELISAQVGTEDGFQVLSRESLFSTKSYQRGDEYCCHPAYDVSPDGSRFIMIRRDGGAGDVVLVQNVFQVLRDQSEGGG